MLNQILKLCSILLMLLNFIGEPFAQNTTYTLFEDGELNLNSSLSSNNALHLSDNNLTDIIEGKSMTFALELMDDFFEFYAGPSTLSYMAGNEYCLSNFLSDYIGTSTEDLTLSLTYDQNGNATMCLPGQGTVTLFTNNNKDYKLWFASCNPVTGLLKKYSNDIVFYFDKEGNLYFPDYHFEDFTICGIGWTDEDSRGGMVGVPRIKAHNGHQTGLELSDDSQSWCEREYPLYVTREVNDNGFTIWGISNAPMPCKFIIEDDKVIAANQQAYISNNANPNDYFYYTQIGNGDNILIGNYSENGTSHEICLNDCCITNSNDYYGVFTDTSLKFSFETTGEIKHSLTIENSIFNTEYYTLQGIRVANPVPGQLYILKRGNSASKVIAP